MLLNLQIDPVRTDETPPANAGFQINEILLSRCDGTRTQTGPCRLQCIISVRVTRRYLVQKDPIGPGLGPSGTFTYLHC